MQINVRPESMARINNFELANAFIQEAIPQVLTHRRALKFEILPQIYLKLT